ncbi:MAG: sulfate permease [Synechococcus sp.]|nr:sulfate permease [Synechococcus sp.]
MTPLPRAEEPPPEFDRSAASPSGLQRLLRYERAWLPADTLAGLTVTAYLIPQCMAYAELAGVEPIAGLWAMVPCLLLYGLLGSSPQLSVGPESTTAVLTAAAIAPLAAADPAGAAGLASLLALLVGLVCALAAWARLGFLADLLSRPILAGYMAGVAVIMITSQLGRICGVALEAESIPAQIQELIRRHGELHCPTLALALAVLAFLLLLQRRWPRLPGPLLAVLLATAAVALFRLDRLGVAVIGAIPAGLPPLQLPPLPGPAALQTLVPAALGIALVGYSDNVLTARAFAARNGYRIDANRELLALGAVNVGAGLLRGFPVSSSGSRTAIGDAAGSRTQLFSLVSLAALLLVLLLLRPLLALFPRAALGAIVIYAGLRLIDLEEFRRLRDFKASEFHLALITLIGVLGTDLLRGVALAVTLSVLNLFARLARPNDAVLGSVPGLEGLHDIRDWSGASTLPGLVIYRFDAPLCFANSDHFRRRVLEVLQAETTPVQWLVLNAEAIVDIDSTAVAALEALQQELEARGITLAIARAKQDLLLQLQKTELLERIGPERLYPTLGSARAAFLERLSPGGRTAAEACSPSPPGPAPRNGAAG